MSNSTVVVVTGVSSGIGRAAFWLYSCADFVISLS